MHRDISLNNLMLRMEGDKVYGVLNDFDLAVLRDVQSPSSKQRTGTKPFMAIDLLQRDAPIHMYRHDLESMFYVILWITSRFHNGEEIANPPLQEWADKDDTALLHKKSRLIFHETPPAPTPQFVSLRRRWVIPMLMMIAEGFSTRRRYLLEEETPESATLYFDDETLGGLVTLDKFQAILDIQLQ
jgi:serine/threonine protein kinase